MAKPHIYVFFKVKKITSSKDPMAKTWSRKYDSAYIPPGSCPDIPSGRPENCMRSNDQIKILGACRGWENLSGSVQAKTTRVRPTSKLGGREGKWLQEFIEKIEEKYNDEGTNNDDDSD